LTPPARRGVLRLRDAIDVWVSTITPPVDRSVPMLLKRFENRLCGYRGIGCARNEARLGFAPPPEEPEEPTIEFEEEARRYFDDDE